MANFGEMSTVDTGVGADLDALIAASRTQLDLEQEAWAKFQKAKADARMKEIETAQAKEIELQTIVLEKGKYATKAQRDLDVAQRTAALEEELQRKLDIIEQEKQAKIAAANTTDKDEIARIEKRYERRAKKEQAAHKQNMKYIEDEADEKLAEGEKLLAAEKAADEAREKREAEKEALAKSGKTAKRLERRALKTSTQSLKRAKHLKNASVL